MENIEHEVVAVIAEISGFEEDEITRDSSLADDLDIDSIKAIEITVALEKKYKIKIRDEDIETIRTVRDAVDRVNELVGIKE